MYTAYAKTQAAPIASGTRPVKKLTKLQKAKKDIAECVSVAGVKEAIQEEVLWIRLSFWLCLLMLLCLTLYYTYTIIEKWAQHRYIDTIEDKFGHESLAVSNVTICAEVYINETFVKNNVVFPKYILDRARNESGISEDEFRHQYAYFLARTTRVRHFSKKLISYFRLLYKTNPQVLDYGTFLRKALPPCENVLKKCKFDGQPFDCCANVRQMADDGGVCYQIAIGYDNNAVQKSDRTYRQQILGPHGGLEVEVAIDLMDVFTPDHDDSANGFRIYVSPTMAGQLMSPVTAPSGTETFIKVTASERLLAKDCIKSTHLPPMLSEESYYDVYGHYCFMDISGEQIRTHVSCDMPQAHYWPNASRVCSPESIGMMERMIQGDYENLLKVKWSLKWFENLNDRMLEIIRYAQETLPLLAKKCLKHCRYWEYSATASFSERQSDDPLREKSAMFSKIHVFYPDYSYRQHEETLAVPSYLAFCEFGDAIALYLGMSLVTLAEIVYYGWGYCYARGEEWRKKRKKNRVAPEP